MTNPYNYNIISGRDATGEEREILVTAEGKIEVSGDRISSATILSLQTSATGTNFAAFSSQACTQLDIQNLSGTDIEYRRGGTGNTFRIPNGTGRLIMVIANANEISIRRVDVSNTQVTIAAEAIA